MLCWRTGRGKPQEGVRGRERERREKQRPDGGVAQAEELRLSCQRCLTDVEAASSTGLQISVWIGVTWFRVCSHSCTCT